MNNRPLLTLSHVNKFFNNGTHAVKDFNLTVNSGEFIGFVGPSGDGKSTLLRLIVGLSDRSSGRIEYLRR